MAKEKKKTVKRSFVTGYDDGVQQRLVARGRSVPEAEALLRQKIIEYEQGKLIVNSGTTFGVWAGKWLEIYKKPKVEPNSYLKYKAIIKNHTSLISQMPLKDIKPINLQALLNAHEGKSKSQTKKIYLTLKQIFRQAVIDDLLIKDPMLGVTMPKTIEGEKRALTESEKAIFFKAAAKHRAGAWILLMLCCGLRRGETVPLTWANVDLSNHRITVNKAVTFEGVRARAKAPKTSAGNRTVPIPDILADALKALPRRSDTTLLFSPERTGGMLTKNHLVKMWQSFMREADILAGATLYRNAITNHAIAQDITPHMLRHTYATDLYRMGVDLKTAQYLLGHSDIRMTSDIYTHAEQDKAMGILPLQNAFYSPAPAKKKRYKLLRGDKLGTLFENKSAK